MGAREAGGLRDPERSEGYRCEAGVPLRSNKIYNQNTEEGLGMIGFFSEVPELSGERIILRHISMKDAEALQSFAHDEEVYRYLPTFLFEQRYSDARTVIERLYTECMEESLILGIYMDDSFAGLAELYGFRDPIHKVSIGYRLAKEYWGRGIATETVRILVDYLYGSTDIEIITASTLPENHASENVLQKNDFQLVVSGSDEDWGYPEMLPTDKWIR